MLTKNLLVILCLVQFAYQDWYYGNEDEWPALCKNGKRQSPINIISKNCEIFEKFNRLQFFNYESNYDVMTQNNGHSIELRLTNNNNIPVITGGLLTKHYVLDNIHFHWFSEHIIDNKRYPLEAHFVHYDNKFANLSEASTKNNSIVVLSVLFENGPGENDFFQQLFKSNISKLHSSVTMNNLLVGSLLPNNLADYYSYEGSLTTPSCSETVKWIIFKDNPSIHLEDILKFQEIKTDHGDLTRNFRQLQDLNHRTVTLYKTSKSYATHNIQTTATTLITTSLFVVFVAICWL